MDLADTALTVACLAAYVAGFGFLILQIVGRS